ncbi:MAG: hypothetical protein J6C52_01700, partial [Clostridia bacterium]|nr:hypothetical protein [Clostridia bacterium]
MKKFTTIAILTAMLASLAACGESAGSAGGDTTAAATDAPETTSRFVADDLPDDLDFGGKTVTWFVGDYNSAYWDDVYADEENGSRVNDAVYNARRAVEERLNIKMEYFRKQVGWSDRADIDNAVAASVMAADGAYDIYFGRNIIHLMLEDDYLLDLSKNKYLNFDKPWWNKSQLSMMPGDQIYVASGDGSLSIIKHTYCVFFNQTQLNKYGVKDDMYALVEDGKWTIDKLSEIAKTGYSDVNGNTTADYGDEFGLTFGDVNKYLGMQFCAGGECITKGSSGYELVYGSEKMVNLFDRCYNLVQNTEGVLPGGQCDASNLLAVPSVGGNYVDKTFVEGKAMFSMSLVSDAAAILADVKFEYGLLPYPKYDEAQKNYISAPQRNAFFALLPYCDADLSGAVLEAWSSEAYRTVQPEYFETTLKARYSSDDNMAAMFDLMRATTRYEIGDYFGTQLNSLTSDFKILINDKMEGQWMSNYSSKEK